MKRVLNRYMVVERGGVIQKDHFDSELIYKKKKDARENCYVHCGDRVAKVKITIEEVE